MPEQEYRGMWFETNRIILCWQHVSGQVNITKMPYFIVNEDIKGLIKEITENI